MKVIHMHRTAGRTTCGVRISPSVQVVFPRQAKFVTCRRCLASLRKFGT